MSLQLAFTGTGYIADVHARAAQKLPDVEMVAVVNHRPASMDAFADRYGIPRRYATVEALLRDGDVDALSINTPNYLHAREAIAALEAGVPVMVEKPMAMDAGEARQMLAAARGSGAPLMVAHCWRFDEEARWLRAQVAQGRIGDVVRTKGYSVHVNWGPAGWFTQKRLAGGGALADMGIHAIDTARYLLGDPQPVRVYARVGTFYRQFDVDDTGIILIDWDNGATSYVESGWWQPHADGPEAGTQLYGRDGLGELFPTRLRFPRAPAPCAVGGAWDVVDPGFEYPREQHCAQRMYDAQLAYFVDCVRSGRTPVPGGREGLVNMRIVDAAYESARSGEAVHIAP
jgi:predicted dehydrogenase